MKPKQRAEIQRLVRDVIAEEKARGPFHTMTLTFEDGRGITIPYLPWEPRSNISLRGRWVVDE